MNKNFASFLINKNTRTDFQKIKNVEGIELASKAIEYIFSFNFTIHSQADSSELSNLLACSP